jgi:hypothetical protein
MEEIRQKISFIIILQSRAYMFLEPPAADPACADSSMRKVLGEVQGVPPAWQDRPMVVYSAELALTQSELAEELPEIRATRVAGGAVSADEPVRPAGPLTVIQDSVTGRDIRRLPVAFKCTWHDVGNDWVIYNGMAATHRAEAFSTFRCRNPEP